MRCGLAPPSLSACENSRLGDYQLSHHPGSSMAAMVEIAFPSSRLFTKTNVRRFGPAAFPSATNARPAARASGFPAARNIGRFLRKLPRATARESCLSGQTAPGKPCFRAVVVD